MWIKKSEYEALKDRCRLLEHNWKEQVNERIIDQVKIDALKSRLAKLEAATFPEYIVKEDTSPFM